MPSTELDDLYTPTPNGFVNILGAESAIWRDDPMAACRYRNTRALSAETGRDRGGDLFEGGAGVDG